MFESKNWELIMQSGQLFYFVIFSLPFLLAFGVAYQYYRYKKASPAEQRRLKQSFLNQPSYVLTADDKRMLENGSLKAEPQMVKIPQNQFVTYLILFSITLTAIISVFYIQQDNCSLIFSLSTRFIKELSLILMLVGLYIYQLKIGKSEYIKAMTTGFLKDNKRTTKSHKIYKKASQTQIKRYYQKMGVVFSAFIFMFIFFRIDNLLDLVQKSGVSSSYFSLTTYQIASQKLQQECLAKKEK